MANAKRTVMPANKSPRKVTALEMESLARLLKTFTTQSMHRLERVTKRAPWTRDQAFASGEFSALCRVEAIVNRRLKAAAKRGRKGAK